MPIQGDAASLLRPTYTNIAPLSTQGNMSMVFSAHHLGFDKPCVQKVVVMSGMPAAIAFAEPRLLDQLRHQKVVPVLETQPDPHNASAIVFTMPFYRQGSIRFALEQGYRFSLQQAVNIGCDLLSALGHLHTNGLVDRDVKSANVLLTDDLREGHLTDLGIAARVESDGRAPGGVGSPYFMPPEAFGPDSRVGPEMDIYGAALTIYELANGPMPYDQLPRPVVDQRLARGLRAMPDSALEFAPHVPAGLRRVIRRGLRVNPAERYQTARQFVDALRPLDMVDWREISRLGLEGQWEGTWPPQMALAQRRGYRVQVDAKRARLVASALQRATATGPWRRFGVADVRLARSDSKALAHFFSLVETRAAQLTPAS